MGSNMACIRAAPGNLPPLEMISRICPYVSNYKGKPKAGKWRGRIPFQRAPTSEPGCFAVSGGVAIILQGQQHRL